MGWGGSGNTSSGGGWGGGGGSDVTNADLLDEEQLKKALAGAKADKAKHSGLLGGLESAAGKALHSVGGGVAETLHVLDKGRAAAVATAHQLGLAAREAAGKYQAGDERASLGNWWDETQHNIGAGDVLKSGGYGAGPGFTLPLIHSRVDARGAAGMGLDIAADPLNAVAPVRSEEASAALRLAGSAVDGGDKVARQLLRQGGIKALRDAVEKGGDKTLEEVLARGTAKGAEGLGKKSGEQVVQERLAALTNEAKGGLRVRKYGIAGPVVSTGIGQATADRTLAKIGESPLLSAARHVFQPSASVLDATGSKASAEGFQTALHERGIAIRAAKAAMGDAAAATDEGKAALVAVGNKAMTDTLREAAPELVDGSAEAGFTALPKAAEGDPLVHQSVVDALKEQAPDKAQTALGKFGQEAVGKVKQYTVFGPQNAIQHDAKRTLFNSLRATTSGGEGVKDALSAALPGIGSEGKDIYKAATAILKDGGQFTPEEFAARGLDEQAAKRAAALAPGIMGDNPLYEVGDAAEGAKKGVGRLGASKSGAFGTRNAAHFAERNGTINRFGVALKALDEGASPLAAVGKARDALLDFSNEGLTKSEKKLEKAAFFYKFPRRAIPAGVQFAAEHPGETAVLTRLGAGIGTGPRNQYGQVTHLMPDTPLEAAFGDIGEATSNPVGYATDNANPFLSAGIKALSGGSVKAGDWLPPVSQAQSLNKRILNNEAGPKKGLEAYAPKLAGLNPGEDYVAEKAAKKESAAEAKAQASAADRKAAGEAATKKDRLTALAKKHGIPNPYSTSEEKILEAAVKDGATAKELLKALKG